jgi:putative PIN family toxin of toxin-antitoxin system
MKKRLKIVVDTNIFISALLGSKNSKFIIEKFINGEIDIVITDEIFLEIVETLKDRKFRKIVNKDDLDILTELLKIDAEWVIPEKRVNACRDKKDNIILECALSGKVDFIITGDNDLLSLKFFEKVLILTPSQFLKISKK